MNPLRKQNVGFLTCMHAMIQNFFFLQKIVILKCQLLSFSDHAKMMELALITSMISFASANPPTLAKLARSKWTRAVLTTAPMEQPVPRPPISGTTFALVLSDSLADFAMKTSTNVPLQLLVGTAENVSILPEVTRVNVRKASKVGTA